MMVLKASPFWGGIVSGMADLSAGASSIIISETWARDVPGNAAAMMNAKQDIILTFEDMIVCLGGVPSDSLPWHCGWARVNAFSRLFLLIPNLCRSS